MIKLYIVSFILITVFLSCVFSNIVIAEDINSETQAEKAQLDLNLYDTPNDNVDKNTLQHEYPLDTPEVQMQKFTILNNYIQLQNAKQEITKQHALSNLDSMINDFNTIKARSDKSRKSYNNNLYRYPIYPYYRYPRYFNYNIPYYPIDHWGY